LQVVAGIQQVANTKNQITLSERYCQHLFHYRPMQSGIFPNVLPVGNFYMIYLGSYRLKSFFTGHNKFS